MGRFARRGFVGVLAALSFAAPVIVSTAVPAGAATPNLRGLWHLDSISKATLPLLTVDMTADSSGNGNDGVVTGATQAAGLFTQSGFSTGGLRFNPFDSNGGDSVDVKNNPSLDITGPITVEAWFNAVNFTKAPGEPDSNIMLVSKSKLANDQSWGLGVTNEPFGAPDNICGTLAARPAAFFYAVTAGGVAITCSNVAVTTGTFHHLAGRYVPSLGYAQLWMDGLGVGSVVTSTAPGSALKSSTANIQIGARPFPGYKGFFNGVIDEVRVWSRALGSQLTGEAPEIEMSADMGLQTERAGGSGGLDAGLAPTAGASVPTIIGQDSVGDVFTQETARVDGNTTRVNWYVLTADAATRLIDPDNDGNVVEHLEVTTTFNCSFSFVAIDTNDDGVPGDTLERRGVQVRMTRTTPGTEMRVGFKAFLTNGQTVTGFVLER